MKFRRKKEVVLYKERNSDEILEEKVAGVYWLRWLYTNPIGKLSLETMAKRKFLSVWSGKLMKGKGSKKKIKPFVKNFNIRIDEIEGNIEDFESFNEFFIRKLKSDARKINEDEQVVISPGDGKLLVYPHIDSYQNFRIKGFKYTLKDFLRNLKWYEEFKDGSMAILRLCPTDYHRYHFPIEGVPSEVVRIKGDYYSVSPIALRKKMEIFCRNKREFTEINSKYYGKVLMVDVGATFIGSIVQTYIPNINYKKGDEKGYFEFGGSSIVLIFKKNVINFDEDLIENTVQGYETIMKLGESIGKLNNG
jgi:phosphatidylserine decarboxylase